jgi:Do/DeqQ family serine protease
MQQTAKTLTFLAGAAIGGLALAFVIVALRPDLLQRKAPDSAAHAPTAPASLAAAESKPASAASGESTARTAAGPSGPETGSYAEAVRRASPAVVNIYTARVVTERRVRSPLEDFFGDMGPRYRQRVERALGSGVIIDASGRIVTNHHVVADADEVRVQLADGRVAEARIVGRDPDTDLAVLKIDLPRLPVMPLGRSDLLQVGDAVLAIGNPIGLQQTVTHGIVSATGRGQLGIATFENFIQTDAPINAGNSGGALVNARGELIGINTAVVAKSMGVEGIGFAIPVNLVRGVIDEIIAKGKVVRGWAGFVLDDLSDQQAADVGLAKGGVVITNLYNGSPALQLGLQPGDLIEAIDGKALLSAQDANARVASSKPGATLKLTVVRGTQRANLEMKISERPVR